MPFWSYFEIKGCFSSFNIFEFEIQLNLLQHAKKTLGSRGSCSPETASAFLVKSFLRAEQRPPCSFLGTKIAGKQDKNWSSIIPKKTCWLLFPVPCMAFLTWLPYVSKAVPAVAYPEWIKTWKGLFLTEQVVIVRNKVQ